MDIFQSNLRVLVTTEKHWSVRQSADKRNAKRMMVKYNIQHKVKAPCKRCVSPHIYH